MTFISTTVLVFCIMLLSCKIYKDKQKNKKIISQKDFEMQISKLDHQVDLMNKDVELLRGQAIVIEAELGLLEESIRLQKNTLSH